MAKKQLTEMQKLLIHHLFDEDVKGNVRKAMKKAGYADKTTPSEATRGIKDEIIEATKDYLVRSGPTAVVALMDSLDTPAALGVRNKLQAVKEVLDRAGIVKPEKIEVETSGGVVLLPYKQDDEPDSDAV